MNNFRRNKILNTVVIVLLVLLGVGVIAFIGNSIISNLSSDEGYEKVSMNYERGALTSYGKYEETDYSIYTKQSYDLHYGLKAELDFDSTIMYQFYFYDELDNFVGSSEVFEKSVNLSLEECFNAKKYRVVITPIYDNELKDDEKVVKWYEINKYANQLYIQVLVDEVNEKVDNEDETISEQNFLLGQFSKKVMI